MEDGAVYVGNEVIGVHLANQNLLKVATLPWRFAPKLLFLEYQSATLQGNDSLLLLMQMNVEVGMHGRLPHILIT